MGTFITTHDVSSVSAAIDLDVTIDNNSKANATVEVHTEIFILSDEGSITGEAVGSFEPVKVSVAAGQSAGVKSSVVLANPRLWGPPPSQTPHRYAAVTAVRHEGKLVDQYETRFGIRSLRFDPNTGIHVNGERIFVKGVNQHHDLGALGAAFNVRAAERQLEILREMGCNAIRMAHNPPASELLELTDRMGFLVVNEIFDVWERKKAPLDFHLIFPDWFEQDTRAWVRRDRNHPSVMMWSFGNEVGEQYTGQEGAAVARRLHDIVKDEDPTRPTTAAMNYAKPDMPMPKEMDVISLNYQGEGIRNAPAYAGLRGINTPPLYPAFREAFPDKVILSSENAAALSTRGTYLFPVFDGISAPVKDGSGGDSKTNTSALTSFTPPNSAPRPTRYLPRRNSTPLSPEGLSGAVGIISASRRLITARAVPISGSLTLPDSKRIVSICINPTGAPTCRWRTYCRTGTGRTASAKSHLFTCSPPATKRNCFSTAGRWAVKPKASINIACVGTMWCTSRES